MIGTAKTMKCLEKMLDDAMEGEFEEKKYDESRLSRLETKWKNYLANSKMSMNQVEKERAEMKSLVSDISHQTKTPLANILLYTDLLKEKVVDSETQELVDELKDQADKLQFLIESLVKMSRLESDTIEVVPELQNIDKLISETLTEHHYQLEQKEIRLVYIPLECKSLYDLKWTKEAIGNILDNAIKYSPTNSKISVSVKQFDFYICISICDQGIGIQEEEKSQIFSRFYRSPRVQQYAGVGIGLYLSRQIIQKENGYIKVECNKDGGSTFHVYLKRDL